MIYVVSVIEKEGPCWSCGGTLTPFEFSCLGVCQVLSSDYVVLADNREKFFVMLVSFGRFAHLNFDPHQTDECWSSN